MKRQSTKTNHVVKNTRIGDRRPATKKSSHYIYTEADLGEDILNISLCSVYSAAQRLMQNIYGRMYAFQ